MRSAGSLACGSEKEPILLYLFIQLCRRVESGMSLEEKVQELFQEQSSGNRSLIYSVGSR
jgi:hypothetical protein